MLTETEIRILSQVDESAKKKRKDKGEEALGAAGAATLLRGEKKQESMRIRETAVMGVQSSIIQAPDSMPKDPGEGPVVKVVLLTEGLGNMRDKNYYGPEAVRSMPLAFEGAPMMVDHPSYSEEKDIPEGRVNKTVGYYKNLHVESVNGRLGCVGEVHFDLSDDGWNAFQKAKTAIHYAQEFPNSGKDYIGLSVNAAGESEARTMTVEGQKMDVNYVLRFVEARSCDMVTIPARGGRFVALMESIWGARMKKEETRMETLKRLEAAQAALKEAEGEKDADKRQVKLAEALTVIESLSKDVREAAAKSTAETKKKEDDGKGKDDGDEDESCEAEAEEESKAKPKEKKGKEKESDDAVEAKRYAVKALIAESGLNPKYFDAEELNGLSLKEAKREIARVKRVHEASAEEILKRFGDDVSAGHPMRESAGGGEGVATRNSEFPVISA